MLAFCLATKRSSVLIFGFFEFADDFFFIWFLPLALTLLIYAIKTTLTWFAFTREQTWHEAMFALISPRLRSD